MPINASVTGVTEMQERIRALRAGIREQGVRDGVRAGAAVIRDAMIAAAPVLDEKTANSTSLDPGAMKEDIRSRLRATDKQGFASSIIGPGAKTAHVAFWVEFGHRLVRGGHSKVLASGKTQGPGREVGFVPAHPFLRPAFEGSIDDALAAFAAKVRQFFMEVLR